MEARILQNEVSCPCLRGPLSIIEGQEEVKIYAERGNCGDVASETSSSHLPSSKALF